MRSKKSRYDDDRYYDGDGKYSKRIRLTPSPNGEKCLGNGEHKGIEIRCDECNFFLECFPETAELKTTKERF